MTPFEKLVADYENIQGQINRLKIRKKELEKSNGLSGKKQDGMPRTKSNSSSVENVVIKIMQLEEKISSLDEKLENKRVEITNAIDVYPDYSVRKIVELKTFIERITWYEISLEVGYGEDYCPKLYNKAIEEINTYLSQKEGNL